MGKPYSWLYASVSWRNRGRDVAQSGMDPAISVYHPRLANVLDPTFKNGLVAGKDVLNHAPCLTTGRQ